MDRLREFGYPVHATMGAVEGYRLDAGAQVPPLLLDDEEAVAVAVGLRTAAGGSIEGIEETSVRALTKLEQVLPSRLRHRMNALHSATVSSAARARPSTPLSSPRLRVPSGPPSKLCSDYVTYDGSETRWAEPLRLVSWGWKRYLLAWDDDWWPTGSTGSPFAD